MKKRGLSPVIATMLLVVIVIIIGLIIFMWFRGVAEEAVTKFNGKNVKLVCDEIDIQASYDSSTLIISNIGNVPIYKIKARAFDQGEYTTTTLSQDWPSTGLNQGGIYTGTEISGSYDKILLLPVLLGSSEKGELAYTCEERHAYEII